MQTGNKAFFLLVIGLLAVSAFVNTAAADRARTGNTTLSGGESIQTTIEGYQDGQIEVEINATEGPLWIFVLNRDLFVNVSEIQSFECVVYEHEAKLDTTFDVETDSDWILVILNTNSFDVHVEFSLSSREPVTESVAITMMSASALYLFFVLGGYIAYVHRGVFPEIKNVSDSTMKPAIIGGLFILLSLTLPAMLQLGVSGYTGGDILQALFWDLRPSGFQVYLGNTTNPYAMLIPLIMIGPSIIFPFSLISYYQGRTTKRRMVLVGVISILPMLVFAGLGIVAMIINPLYPLLEIPLPLVFILGLIITKFVHAPAVPDNLADWKRNEEI